MQPREFFRKCNYDKATAIKSQLLKVEKPGKQGETMKITEPAEVKRKSSILGRDNYDEKKNTGMIEHTTNNRNQRENM